MIFCVLISDMHIGNPEKLWSALRFKLPVIPRATTGLNDCTISKHYGHVYHPVPHSAVANSICSTIMWVFWLAATWKLRLPSLTSSGTLYLQLVPTIPPIFAYSKLFHQSVRATITESIQSIREVMDELMVQGQRGKKVQTP